MNATRSTGAGAAVNTPHTNICSHDAIVPNQGLQVNAVRTPASPDFPRRYKVFPAATRYPEVTSRRRNTAYEMPKKSAV